MEIVSNDSHLLSVRALLNTEIPLYSKVSVAGDNRLVSLTGPGSTCLGTLSSRPIHYPGYGGVDVQWKKETIVPVSAPVTAGKYAKIGTPDAEGNQRYTEWVSGTDSPTLIEGYFMTAGTSEATMLTT